MRRRFKSDLRNAAVAEEAYFAQKSPNSLYETGVLASAKPLGFNKTALVTTTAAAPTADTFTLSAVHANCGATAWVFTSTTGAITGGLHAHKPVSLKDHSYCWKRVVRKSHPFFNATKIRS